MDIKSQEWKRRPSPRLPAFPSGPAQEQDRATHPGPSNPNPARSHASVVTPTNHPRSQPRPPCTSSHPQPTSSPAPSPASTTPPAALRGAAHTGAWGLNWRGCKPDSPPGGRVEAREACRWGQRQMQKGCSAVGQGHWPVGTVAARVFIGHGPSEERWPRIPRGGGSVTSHSCSVLGSLPSARILILFLLEPRQ